MTLPIRNPDLYERDEHGCVIPIKNEENCDSSGHYPYGGRSMADNIVERNPNLNSRWF